MPEQVMSRSDRKSFNISHMAKHLFDKAEVLPFVKYGRDKLTPLYNKVSSLVKSAKNECDEAKKAVVSSSWFQKVDHILRSQPMKLQQLEKRARKELVSYQQFYKVAIESFINNQFDKNPNFESFVKDLKVKLIDWDETYLAPTKLFYVNAREQVKNVDIKKNTNDAKIQVRKYLKDLNVRVAEYWQQSIIGTNALHLYNLAVERYRFIAKSTKTSDVQMFLKDMQERLGTSWNDKLAQPLAEFYNRANSVSFDDLKALRLSTSSSSLSMKQIVNQMKGSLDNTIDWVLPETMDGLPKKQSDSSFRAMSEKVRTRVQKRAYNQLNNVSNIVNTRLDNVTSYVKPKTNQVRTHLGRIWSTTKDLAFVGWNVVSKRRIIDAPKDAFVFIGQICHLQPEDDDFVQIKTSFIQVLKSIYDTKDVVFESTTETENHNTKEISTLYKETDMNEEINQNDTNTNDDQDFGKVTKEVIKEKVSSNFIEQVGNKNNEDENVFADENISEEEEEDDDLEFSDDEEEHLE